MAKSQVMQTQARLDELKITLSNTNIISPVDGFVGKRNLDPGAFAGANTPILSVVDIGTVRLVANLVEKDFKRVEAGVQAKVEVDAFPGETFTGRVSRVAPVFDPATRTAAMEIEVPNPGFRLKPGMYARVQLTAERRTNASGRPPWSGRRPRGAARRVRRRRLVHCAASRRFTPGCRTRSTRKFRTGCRRASASSPSARLRSATATRSPCSAPARADVAAAAQAATRRRREESSVMSIPRLAIERPITMFMISAVVVLLGAISLARLPVDLMPDVTYPSITVRVGYSGVGPLEIEELIVRPLEQSLAAVPALEQINSTAAEGSGTVRLNFAWGTNLSEAADEVRTRVDRVRGRLPQEADSPSIQKFDASTQPIMSIGVEGNYDRVTLREMAENDLSQRFERIEGVAAVTVNGGLRRQIHVELSKEKITALDLSVDRIVSTIRSENQNIPLGEVRRRRHDLPPPQPGSVPEPRRDPRRWSCRRRAACRCTCETSRTSSTRPKTSARSPASTASRAYVCR